MLVAALALAPMHAPDTIAEWPDCPKCGCNALNHVGERIHRGVVFDQWECDYCGYQRWLADAKQLEAFLDSEPDREVVFVKSVKCLVEKCRSRRVWTYRTSRSETAIVRYHRCLVCDFRFKSLEKL